MGCLHDHSFPAYYRLRENNKDIACWLLTGCSGAPRSVLSTVEEAGHHSSAGQGNPRKEKQWDNREDIVLRQLAGFPIFSSRQCVNQRDSLLRRLGHCKPMLRQRQWKRSHRSLNHSFDFSLCILLCATFDIYGIALGRYFCRTSKCYIKNKHSKCFCMMTKWLCSLYIWTK